MAARLPWFKFDTRDWSIASAALSPFDEGVFVRICVLVHARGKLGALTLPTKRWPMMLRIDDDKLFDNSLDTLCSVGAIAIDDETFDGEREITCAMVAESEKEAEARRTADSQRKRGSSDGIRRNPKDSKVRRRIPKDSCLEERRGEESRLTPASPSSPSEPKACQRCEGSGMFTSALGNLKCCDCKVGRERAARYARSSEQDEEQQRRVEEARAREPTAPVSIGVVIQ